MREERRRKDDGEKLKGSISAKGENKMHETGN